MVVEVINMRTCKDWGKPGDVLIDRRTKWGNPFKLNHMSREDSIKNYAFWFIMQEKFGRLDIKELKDAKRLGCWCKPLACHGDYLKKRIEEYQQVHP